MCAWGAVPMKIPPQKLCARNRWEKLKKTVKKQYISQAYVYKCERKYDEVQKGAKTMETCNEKYKRIGKTQKKLKKCEKNHAKMQKKTGKYAKRETT